MYDSHRQGHRTGGSPVHGRVAEARFLRSCSLGVDVTAEAFAHAVAATDEPPLLVVLNACNSAAQLPLLVGHVAPFAIGMSAEIDDGDAINYAAQFYAAVANGQSIMSAHLSGRAALELAGLSGADLPTLASADDVDPAQTILVKPPK